MRKHWVIAFSLANFCFFNAWREVLSPQGFSYLYYWKQYPGYAALAALLINVLLLTAIFVSGFHLLRKLGGATGEQIGQALLLLVFLRAINNIRAQFEILNTSHIKSVIGRAGYIALVSGLLLLIGWAIKRYGLNRVARATTLILLIWSPFGVVGFAQATWWTVKLGRAFARERPPAPILQTNDVAKPRVVWIIFDELDEHISFAARPATLSLPEFDRLRAESLVATNAFPPAGHTSQSLPALLTGHLIAAVKPTDPGELLLTLPNATTVNWSEQRDVFTDARAIGFDSSLVGWLHPYCRVIGHHLTNCQWEPTSERIDPTRLGLRSNLLRQFSDLLRLLPFSSRPRNWLSAKPRNYQAEHQADFLKLMDSVRQTVADKRFGLVFIHLPVPHPPYLYHRSTGTFSAGSEGSYLDNVALADRVLGELRKEMEQANIWERSTIVVSSDHWWRSDFWRALSFWSATDQSISEVKPDHRVPFMVKMARQKQTTQYEAPFNTVLTHDLVLDVLKGGISDQSQLTQWLNSHRTIGESPYRNYLDTE